MNDPNIDQAIVRVQAGSADDYETVVAAYHRRLCLWLAAFCPPGVEPDEITHLAFLEAYRRIARYKIGTDFFAWLCAFARNLVLTERERIQRRARNQQNYLELCLVEEHAAAAKAAASPVDVRSRLLAECVELLKHEARQLIAWRYGEGIRLDAIARQLGRSASAVSVQLFGLRKLLKDCITGKLTSDSSGTGNSHGSATANDECKLGIDEGQREGIHADRTAGGDRDHRHSRGNPSSRSEQSQAAGAGGKMPE